MKDFGLYQLDGVRVMAWSKNGGGGLLVIKRKDWQEIENDGVRVLVEIVSQADSVEHVSHDKDFALFVLSIDAQEITSMVREIVRELAMAGALA